MISKLGNSDEESAEVARQLFGRLSRAYIEEGNDVGRTVARLRQLPEAVAYYSFGAAAPEARKRVAPLIDSLRREAARMIRTRLDRSAFDAGLRELLERGRRELHFREWRVADLHRFIELLDDERMWRYMPEDYPAPLDEPLARRLIELSVDVPHHHLVRAVEWRGEVIGQVRLQFDSTPAPDTAEISYWTGRPYAGLGLTTAAVARFTRECFDRYGAIDHIVALVIEGNEASLRVLEKAGYYRDGFRHRNVVKRDGRALSSHELAVRRDDYPA